MNGMDFDDEVEVKFEENLLNRNANSGNGQNYEQNFSHVAQYSNQNYENNSYSNVDVRRGGTSAIFQKKYLAILFSTISIILTLFMKFIAICGATSKVFFGIWFFLSAGFVVASLVLTVLNSIKAKKLSFNVSSVMTFLAIIALLLI